jgi:hypothetical protein
MYYIYHIPGIKIGCSKNPKRRVKQQGYTEFIILETHTDIQVASERERSLQKEYGLKVDTTTYSKSIQGYSLDKVINAGRTSLEKQWKENRQELIERSKLSKPIMIEKYGKEILQYHLDGKFIKEWKGIKEAARILNIKPPNLSATLNGRQKTCGGFIWKFKITYP